MLEESNICKHGVPLKKEEPVIRENLITEYNQECSDKNCQCQKSKSTLREATLKIVRTVADLQAEPVADEILSLFKDTLLKEFPEGKGGMSLGSIRKIIKNL